MFHFSFILDSSQCSAESCLITLLATLTRSYLLILVMFFLWTAKFLEFSQKEENKETSLKQVDSYSVLPTSEWNGAYLNQQLCEFHIPPWHHQLSHWHSVYTLRFIAIHSERMKGWLKLTYCKFRLHKSFPGSNLSQTTTHMTDSFSYK